MTYKISKSDLYIHTSQNVRAVDASLNTPGLDNNRVDLAVLSITLSSTTTTAGDNVKGSQICPKLGLSGAF